MTPVFDALNSIEAHLIRIYLLGEGIEARVGGDYLQGAMGELPALGVIRIWVEDSDKQRAQHLLENWNSKEAPDDSWIPPELR